MKNIPPKPKPLRSVEVMHGKIVKSEEITEFGKETVKQALVWTIAGYLTKGFRAAIDAAIKSAQRKPT